jgi:signal transduction histidine kinase
MKAARNGGPAAKTGPHPPVVVSFGRAGELLDVVGDLDRFVGDDAHEDVYARLRDLRSGDAGMPDRIPALELSRGRYADVQVVEEEESCHFVLRDATEVMRVLQRKQQDGNELELRERRQRKALRKDGEAPQRARTTQPFRRDAELFAALADEMRAPLSLLAGHVRLLQQRLPDDPALLRSLAAIQHAAVRLEAMANNALVAAGELDAGRGSVLELAPLAALLQQSFGLQARAQGVAFEVRLPRREAAVEVDDLALRQVLFNLVIHALDGMSSGTLALALGASAGGLEIEIAREPDGFDAAHFGPLLTTSDLLGQGEAGGSYALAVSQLLLLRMRAKMELVPRKAGGHELWIRLPLARAAAEAGQLRLRETAAAQAPAHDGRIAVVAVEPAPLASAIVERLAALGVPALAVPDAPRAEALLREGAVSLLALSARFDGKSARGFARRGGHEVALLLLDADERGWRRDGRCVRVSPQADADTLQAALAAALAR